MPVSESATRLRIGHLNVYHLFNKAPDVSLLLNQSSQLTHLFGISETRLDSRIDNNSIRIPDYCVMRRDSSQTLHTGIALYVHQSIAMNIRRRTDLESEGVECAWVEINDLKSPSLLVGYVYRNPAYPAAWFDNLHVDMWAVYTDVRTFVYTSSSVHTCVGKIMDVCIYKYVYAMACLCAD